MATRTVGTFDSILPMVSSHNLVVHICHHHVIATPTGAKVGRVIAIEFFGINANVPWGFDLLFVKDVVVRFVTPIP